MKLSFFIILAVIIFSIYFASQTGETCSDENLGHLNINDIECQYYMGTSAYQNKDYKTASFHWNNVLNSELKNTSDKKYYSITQGNMGYLLFYGFGGINNQTKAIELWKTSLNDGAIEPRSHLGFAYSNEKRAIYDVVKGYAWLKSHDYFTDFENLNDIDEKIIRDARKKINKLKNIMTEEQIIEAEMLAKTIN